MNTKKCPLPQGLLLLLCASCVAAFFSCTSTNQVPSPAVPTQPAVEQVAEPTIRTVAYSGGGIKLECEAMLLNATSVIPDASASGGAAIRLDSDASRAQVRVQLPAGTYECLVAEKAFDNAHSSFYVYIDETPYRVYPSNPPLGFYELTTRTPVYVTLDEPRTILVTLRPHSDAAKGSVGMSLDYMQFVRQ